MPRWKACSCGAWNAMHILQRHMYMWRCRDSYVSIYRLTSHTRWTVVSSKRFQPWRSLSVMQNWFVTIFTVKTSYHRYSCYNAHQINFDTDQTSLPPFCIEHKVLRSWWKGHHIILHILLHTYTCQHAEGSSHTSIQDCEQCSNNVLLTTAVLARSGH